MPPFLPPSFYEKRQIIHRLPIQFVRQTIADFNAGAIDATEACALLDVGKTRLYQLRSLWLKDRSTLALEASGGNQRGIWPEDATAFLREFLPLQSPPNYQPVADELLRLHDLRRSRSSVEAYVKKHLSHLIPRQERKPRLFRRFRRARFGELWQHDSSIHQWWYQLTCTLPRVAPCGLPSAVSRASALAAWLPPGQTLDWPIVYGCAVALVLPSVPTFPARGSACPTMSVCDYSLSG